MSTERDQNGRCPRCGITSNTSSLYCDCQEISERGHDATIADLRAKVAALERDGARLDWLLGACSINKFSKACLKIDMPNGDLWTTYARQAIDAAMAEEVFAFK